MKNMNIQKTYNNYINIFQEISKELKNTDSEIIFKHRQKAFSVFKQLGIPNKKNENYKHADIDNICNKSYDYSIQLEETSVDLNKYFRCEVEDMDTHALLLSNGNYYKKNEPIPNLPKGAIICGLNEAKEKHAKILEKYFNKHASEIKDSFIALNTMLANDGLFIYIPKNTKIDKTIQLVNLTHGFGNKNIFKRNLIILEQGAELSMIICDHTLNNSNNFIVDVSESFVGQNANLQYYALQNEPNKSSVINSHLINLEKDAKVNSIVLSLHGGNIRNNLFTQLSGENSEANLFGLNLTDREQRVDNYTLINHKVPNCLSNELYKGILDDKANGSFAGRIIVHPDAQKTIAYQTNNNLCLTPEAKMRTKPQLEIYADDVKCSHGATVGQLDEEALFYLRQRGIGVKEAKLMLMFAFANDILSNIKIAPLRKRISGLINSRLRGEFTHCSHCLLNCNS